jgi:hypothetical protein
MEWIDALARLPTEEDGEWIVVELVDGSTKPMETWYVLWRQSKGEYFSHWLPFPRGFIRWG